MGVPYDIFTEAFLDKVTEYDFLTLCEFERTRMVDGFMKRACSQFKRLCLYDISKGDDDAREFQIDIPADEIDEIVDIISEGMLVQWMKPYVYRQENYENLLNTADYSGHSVASLLNRIRSCYEKCQKDFARMMNDYSYHTGDLSGLHT